MNVKSIDRIKTKWKRVTSGAQAEYEDGVKNPRSSWAAGASAAEAAYEKGVQASIARKGFGKGVRKAGDQTWQKNAIEKGPARFAQGVSLSEDAYATGFAPYAEALKSVTLSPRGPKGDPANINRVSQVAKALHDKKISLAG
jgi:hypothetical protein